MKINHLSIVVKNPERCSKILAELSNGVAIEFSSKFMQNAWICYWNGNKNECIEFLPKGYLLYSTEAGANFKSIDVDHGYNSTHFQLEVKTSLNQIKQVAEKHKCNHLFRPRYGGPLYEVWIEEQFLAEFVSDEIRSNNVE
jgi:hypothetical protein